MSEQSLKAFMDAVAADAGLAVEMRAAAGVGENEPVPADAMISFASSKGFDVSADDLAGSDDELSDADLEKVAGGAGYIRFDGVDGESRDQDHKKWSDILSMSQATHKPGGR